MNNKINKRNQIIEDAISVLVDGGYASATIGNIAKKGGISKGVITYYFHQKVELMKEIVAYCFASAVPYMEKWMKGLEEPQLLLKGYIESNIRFMFEYKHYVKAMTEIIANARDEAGNLLFQEDDSIYEPLIEIINWGQEIGVFRQFSPIIMAKMIRSTIDSFGMYLVQDKQLDMEVVIREVTETFYFAMKKEGVS